MNKPETAKLQKILITYIKEIHEIYAEKNFREESFYPSLKSLFENCSGLFLEEEGAGVLVLPKRTEVGIPDFLIRKNGEIVGHIEAKTPDSNLQDVENSEQIQRYRNALPNLILTNFLEFRLYRDGKLIKNAGISRFSALESLSPPVPENISEFSELLSEFHSFSVLEITSASKLAVELAKRAKFLKVVLTEIYDKKEGLGFVSIHHVFQESLIESLSKERFVDLCAQTITYGLFAAKVMARDKEINKNNAWEFVPGSLDLLKKAFYVMIGPDAPEAISWIVEDIVKVLNRTDISAIYEEARTVYKQRDPVIQFYETFLREYNPEERGKLGVYYTPIPVVSYIVRSVHKILKRDLNLKDGFADKNVTLLDPAAGTATFVIRAIEEALSGYREGKLAGLVPFVISNHIIPKFYAFELLIVPYVIGHLRMASYLEERWNYRYKEGERFRFYLTNSLEMKEPEQVSLLTELTEESREAKKVKEEVSILVVLGNPPYSVSSENKSDFIENLMEDYKKDIKKEKNIQPLSDDYIKFIRFAHWKIDQTGKGVFGFISNNSYLSGIIHRGMRKELLKTFDEIYIQNLHGSSRIGEKTPEGGKDENVFDIQQGVAIAIYVKLEKPLKEKKVYYADVWGLRKEKYKYLRRNDVTSTDWQELDINKFEEQFSKTRWSKKYKTGFYFFTHKSVQALITYGNFWGVDEIFEEWSSGVETRKDYLTTDISKDHLKDRVLQFANQKITDEFLTTSYKITKSRDWILSEVRKVLFEKCIDSDLLINYSYRPFDNRWIYFEDKFIAYPFRKIFNFGQLNLYLTTQRSTSASWKHALVNQYVVDKHCTGELSYTFRHSLKI